jgi:hypothetical protein
MLRCAPSPGHPNRLPVMCAQASPLEGPPLQGLTSQMYIQPCLLATF